MEGRRKKEEGRRKREEGRGKKEEGRRKREGCQLSTIRASTGASPLPQVNCQLSIIKMLFTLNIKLLGGFCLSHAGRPVIGITTERLKALLAYLVLHRDIPQTRQRLAFQFWEDSTEVQARTNLRRELHHLRQGLPDADRLLLADAKTLQWNPRRAFRAGCG
ncbi:MAG: hypothetical protein HC849_13115 [Oscillatoriales cyanobacterium RU_3_3]|nr:hypothetical protein [Oscillatoriales cyanobacterium RU_3_3]